MERLSSGLLDFDEDSRRDILLEIEDHIDELRRKNPQTSEDEIVAGLEPPEILAKSLLQEAEGEGSGSSPRDGKGTIDGASPADASGSADGESFASNEKPEKEKTGKAKITIDGEDLSDVIKKALDLTGMFRRSKIFREKGADGQGESSRNLNMKDIAVESVERIEVRTKSSDIRVYLSPDGLSLKAHGEESSAIEIEDDEKGTLTVSTGRDHREPESLELWIPLSVDELEVHSLSGDIEVIDRVGALALQTASGDIRVEACDGDMNASTASGDVSIRGCSQSISVKTASGNVEIETDPRCVEISARSASGDIRLLYDDDFDALVSWTTISGSVDCDVKRSSSREAVLGSGLSPVKLSTSSGDIEVRRR
jgi:hypothetical protein